jgi:hypothetical protein
MYRFAMRFHEYLGIQSSVFKMRQITKGNHLLRLLLCELGNWAESEQRSEFVHNHHGIE